MAVDAFCFHNVLLSLMGMLTDIQTIFVIIHTFKHTKALHRRMCRDIDKSAHKVLLQSQAMTMRPRRRVTCFMTDIETRGRPT